MKESQGLPDRTLKNDSIRILGKIIQCLGSALKYSCKNKNLNGRNKGNKNGRTVTTEARKWLHYTFLCFCVILKFSITLKVASILQTIKSLIFFIHFCDDYYFFISSGSIFLLNPLVVSLARVLE